MEPKLCLGYAFFLEPKTLELGNKIWELGPKLGLQLELQLELEIQNLRIL